MEISRRMGCKSSEEATSNFAAIEAFARHRVDILGLSAPDPNLDQVGEFLEIYRIPRSLIVRKKFVHKNDTIKVLLKNPKIKFAGIIGGHFFLSLTENDNLRKSGRLKEYPSPEEIFKALLESRVDAVFSSPFFTHYCFSSMAKEHRKDLIILRDEGEMRPVGIYISKNRFSFEEKEKLRKIVKDIKSDGALLKIATKYIDLEDNIYYSP